LRSNFSFLPLPNFLLRVHKVATFLGFIFLAKNSDESQKLYLNNFYLKINLDLGDRDLTKKNEGNRSRNGCLGGVISFII
jgi:hypothetical protein